MIAEITPEEILILRDTFMPLVGMKIDWLTIPDQALQGFEPSQIAVIVNTLLDGVLPQIQLLATTEANKITLETIGLQKAASSIGQRESYPDYVHISGKRVELKGLFVDNPNLELKRPPTPREPSARLKENVTLEKIDTAKDVLLIAAVQIKEENGMCSPYIVDIEVFSMFECLSARDNRLYETGGKWISGLPKVIRKAGQQKRKAGQVLTNDDYEKDTNFGKLKRIPYKPLQDFLTKWA